MSEPKVPLNYKNLRSKGFTLPKSDVAAQIEAEKVQASLENRQAISDMRRTGSTKTGATTTLALPKVREPMSTLSDKNIPFDIGSPEELQEIRRWARLFYTTHSLIPLIIDIYAKFPIQGIELQCKDPQIKDFYEQMFFDSLDYDTFLQDFGREFFIAGEVNVLGHFNEALGVWASEEILNPDNVHVTKSLFRDGERVQLLVKEIVDAIKDSATSANTELTPSERLERSFEYQELVQNYPEMIQAAATGDGLDVSPALISRVVNKTNAWDVRGTPHMLRCFRDLMMEESLNAAQDAVADRLYSPMILATLGIQNLGDGEPWIPTREDLDETSEMLQSAIAADFRLVTHHMGLDIKSVFGRESVPRFDQDFSRIDKKIMSAWGIGDALISGSNSGTYASSALNREFVTQMMVSYQKNVRKHMVRRMEIVAEAQGHFDYELVGGQRKPIYRNVLERDPDTGEEYVAKVPKLLIPDIKFQSMNLKDESQERQFLQSLKNMGVPISDESLMVNIEFDFQEEIERKANERVQKYVAESQSMKKALQIIKEQGNPIPPELAQYFAAGEQLRGEQVKREMAEEQANATRQVIEQGGVVGDENGLLHDIPGASDFGEMPNMLEDGAGTDQTEDFDPEETDAGSSVTELKPRNRTRPEESDEQRAQSPKAAASSGEGFDPTSWAFGRAPSTFGASKRMDAQRVSAAVQGLGRERDIRVLVRDDEFFASLNREAFSDQIRNDLDEIDRNLIFDSSGEMRLATSDQHVAESFEILQDMMDQYEGIYGYRPEF